MSVSYDRAEVQKSLREKIRRAAAKVKIFLLWLSLYRPIIWCSYYYYLLTLYPYILFPPSHVYTFSNTWYDRLLQRKMYGQNITFNQYQQKGLFAIGIIQRRDNLIKMRRLLRLSKDLSLMEQCVTVFVWRSWQHRHKALPITVSIPTAGVEHQTMLPSEL